MIYESNYASSNPFHRTPSTELCWINCGFSVLTPVRLQFEHFATLARGPENFFLRGPEPPLGGTTFLHTSNFVSQYHDIPYV